MATLTADQGRVRGLVAANPPDDRHRVLAVRAEPVWTGPAVLQVGPHTVRVLTARSPLAVRDVLLDQEHRPGEVTVVLTPCTGSELGLDVRLRLVKSDVLTLDPFAALLAVFSARVLDPQLVKHRWLVDDLVGLAPANGWVGPAPVGGVLDAELAWRTWEQARLGVNETPDDLDLLLRAAGQPTLGRALGDLGDVARQAVAARWGGSASEPAGLIVDLVAAGRGPDVGALGLVAGVLWAVTDNAALAGKQAVARARLEAVIGRDRLDHRSALAWSAAAGRALGGADAPRLDVAERYLHDADADDLAVLSDVLPRGFTGRLSRLGAALTADDVDGAEHRLAEVAAHHQATRRGHQVTAARAAVRLLRRGRVVATPPPTFAAAVRDYVEDGSWVETACRVLDEGDQVPELAQAYAAITASVGPEAGGRDRRFAHLLAAWSSAENPPDPHLAPVEDLLDLIAVPAGTAAPLLVVVCDGMGLAVAHELLDDLRADGWAQVVPETVGTWPAGIATLPTVTEASRTSLLCGRLIPGGQGEEREGFGSHAGLRSVSAPGRPPVLFHKGDLVGSGGMALPPKVVAAIADPDQRVVGAVVNAVDDHLNRGDQVRVEWSAATLRPLRWLLEAAADAQRLVLLTADHGHILHRKESRVGSPIRDGVGGERWRVGPPPAGDDEIEVSGPRVLLGGGSVILPADDRLRYAGSKHGYHGGATPEEVIVPATVLGRYVPERWTYQPPDTPRWWTTAGPLSPPSAPARPVPRPVPTRRDGQDQLFNPAVLASPPGPATTATWVDVLLDSPAFVAHRARVRLPRPIADERLRRYLTPLGAPGGGATIDLLSTATGEPADSVRLALSALQRLLNADGTEVLAVRADGAVTLNRELLSVQFEVPAR
jgi:hypothetical protein